MARRKKTKPSTKKLVCLMRATNKYYVFKYGEYAFKYNAKLEPIPVEVPSDVADILLEMVDSGCRCHNTIAKKMFLEV